MKNRLWTCGLGLVVVMVTAGPAAAQSRREMQMMADIRMLQEQTQQLQQQMLAAVEQLSAALKTITGRVDEQAVATRKSFADQKLAVDQFGTDLRIVRERIDENTVRITRLAQEIEGLRLAIPQFPTAPSAAADPGGSRTDLADDAQFYIGECRKSLNQPTEAIDAYNRVISNYPKGDRVPDAYYKRGIVLGETGQIDRARESLEILMKQFPETELSQLAKQQLDRLNRGKPKA
jgi:tetratricopeptide (TPR) repeat protein